MQAYRSKNSNKETRVLLIEDDRTAQRMVHTMMDPDCRLSMAGSMAAGASLYKHVKPDIVLMDVQLPDGDGYSLLDWIMSEDPGAHVVMFTGDGNTDNIFKSIEKGAKGFMLKPFDPQKMNCFMKKWRKENRV